MKDESNKGLLAEDSENEPAQDLQEALKKRREKLASGRGMDLEENKIDL